MTRISKDCGVDAEVTRTVFWPGVSLACFSISSFLVGVAISILHLITFRLCVSWGPYSLRLGWVGYERPFHLRQGSAMDERDARSFLSTSEGRPCGHWELFSGATGVGEKLPLSAAARVLLARHTSHSCSFPDVFSHQL